MRRITSALTTAVLGAVLTTSMVSAQQSSPPDSAPRGKSTAADSTKATQSTAAATAPLYGMTATRGARYLLRNGLDYLGYQQYERALKFLREAETRQKELNDAEKLALKQGIERAQRGLREASDEEPPYALSERSRRRNGFTPSRPETRVATNSDDTNPPSRKAKTALPAATNILGSDGDDQGEPIRLASGEASGSDVPAETNPSQRSTKIKDTRATDSSETNRPANMPEIPQLPTFSQLPDLTEANGSELRRTTEDGSTAAAEPVAASAPAMPRRTVAPTAESPTEEQAPALVSQPLQAAGMATAEPGQQAMPNKPAGGPAGENIPAAQPDPLSTLPHLMPASEPASQPQDGTANPTAQLAEPATAGPSQAQESPVPTTSGLARPADAAPAPKPTEKANVIDLETIGSSTTARDAAPDAVDPSTLAHKETEDVVPASIPSSAHDAPSAQPTTTPTPSSASPVAGDELPPLPADLGGTAPANSAPDASSAQPTTATAPLSASPAADELPPLPADLGRSAPVAPQTEPTAAPVALPAPPATTSEQPAQPGETAPAHSEEEPSRPLSVGGEGQPMPAAPDGERPQVDGSSTLKLPLAAPGTSATAAPDSAVVPDPSSTSTSTELPPLPGSDAASVASPISHPYPTTNPNLEPHPAATAGTRVETAPDVSSLPPAISNRMPASDADSFIPDRPNPPSTLRPDLQREVEKIARAQEDELRRQVQNPPQPTAPALDTTPSDLRTQTQLDISRAPSPAEARPIKAIPVPEDWVPLPPRSWSAQRKYWAAAATCHLPLYFQDPVLERYGHSVEQFVGPIGKYLTYPVDDPTQSTQRNQIIQPFFSAGLMALQIAAWPYNLIMDPPWEAQYDLGYYRPGDNIPTDTYWLPLHGYGPPLHGSRY